MRKPVVRMAMIAACFAAWFTAAAAQDEDEESPYRSGFIATYSSGADQKAVRIDETVAFDWADAAPDSRLAAGPFSAVWSGRLWTQTPGVHRIAAYVQGRVSVTLAGNRIIEGSADQPQWLVSEPLELEFDRHPLEIAYERKGDGGRLALFWSGPNFVLEPIPERFLMHDRESSPSTDFERGRQLAAALRCIACHRDEAQPDDAMPAPALDRLSGNIEREWLVEWLSSPLSPRGRGARGEGAANEVKVARRMPHFGLSQEEAETVTTWLTRLPVEEGRQIEQKGAKDVRKAGKEKSSKEKKPQPSAEEGERLYLTLGCLACHQHGDLGESGLFGGGDLTNIAAKRPAEFFARWLTDPASLNKHHRMPVFELSADERTSLALWLAKQRAVGNALRGVPPGDVARGEKLIQQFRCAACHTLPGVKDGSRNSFAKQLAAASDWTRSCAGESDAKAQRPGYRLAEDDRSALKTYFSSPAPAAVPGTPQRAFPTARALPPSPQAAGRDLLVQLNCLACHQREGIDRQVNSLPARLQDKLLAVAEAHSELGKLIPAMTPPALNSIGDKLHDAALAAAIRREGPPHRPYLLARMPKFNLSDDQLSALVAYFTTADRVPPIPNELAAAIQNPKSKIQNA
ncbi:MAG TPA: c-type cytochrome, partial [Pirellulaceae bacterium]|nr:c-type cytochrome [Pirellulaceae bacterium]